MVAEALTLLSPRSVDESISDYSEIERQLGQTDYSEQAQLVPRLVGSAQLSPERAIAALAPFEAAQLVRLAAREGREARLLERHALEGAAGLQDLAEREEREAKSTLRRAEAAEARAEALQAAALAASTERIARGSVVDAGQRRAGARDW